MEIIDNSNENENFHSPVGNCEENHDDLNRSIDVTTKHVMEDVLQSICSYPKVIIKALKLGKDTLNTTNFSEKNTNVEMVAKGKLLENESVEKSDKEECLEASGMIEENTIEQRSEEPDTEMITESILIEEQSLQDEGEKETENLKQLAIERFKEMSMNTRLSQLNHLLEKSSIYANYLLDIIEARKKSDKKKALKKEKQQKRNSQLKAKGAAEINVARNECKVSLKKRKRDADQPAAKKRKCDEADPVSGASFQRGDQVCIIKTFDDGEEELLPGTIMDSCFVNDMWKYQVKPKKYKSKKEWVTQSALVLDISDAEGNDASVKTSIILPSALQKIDRNSLFNAKFHRGADASENLSFVDGERYFNGQVIPGAQPEYLSGGVLRGYQVTGFQWLKVLFDNAVNGILADEMGLGKTIQCIAMICRLLKTGFRGPFLVCAPLSTVCNWILEFKKFAPQIPVLLYHGSAAERYILRSVIGKPVSSLNCSPVVVTSYEVLMRDRPALSKHSWDYLIVDEGHRLKNINCRLLKELKALNVTAKVLLTGTPLQNNLTELWSLLNFLLPEVFNDLNTFEAWFDLGEIQKHAKAISSEKEEQIIVMLHKILAPFLLRRTKVDIDVELPPKRELLLFVPLSPSQAALYQAIADRTIRKLFKKDDNNVDFAALSNFPDSCAEAGPVKSLTRSSTLSFRISREKRNIDTDPDHSVINVSLNNLMMQMRKCCNHPYLIKYPIIPGTDIFRIDEELVTSCGKMQLLDQMLPVLKKNGHKVLIFSQMTKILDILQDYCNCRNFHYFRLDGCTKCEDRQQFIDEFNNSSESFLFLLSTRAGGLGINLTAADTVIIYDSDWNPQNDLQAQDRCHRIGQTRPVIIYRFVASNTVDQFMVERAEAKRVLERLVINQSKFKGKLDEDLKSNSSISVQSSTLLSMLNKFGADAAVTGKISDAELTKILDREVVMACSDNDLTCGVFQNIQ